MRSSRKVRGFFLGMVFPALCTACFGYFAYYMIAGPRGLLVLNNTNAQLAVQQEQLQALTDDGDRLQHRVSLLSGPNPDPDLLQEVARDQMIGSVPGQVAIPRKIH